MGKYILKRVIYAIFTVWCIITLTFAIMNVVPGSPFASEGNISPEAIANLEEYYGLNDPLYVQYFSYLKSVVTFDFGPSMFSQSVSVNEYIETGLPISAMLAFIALTIAITGGLLLGIMASLGHNRWPDYIAMAVALFGVSVPSFIFARYLIQIFAVWLELVPVAGWGEVENVILPVIALSAMPMAQIARLTRSGMLEVLQQDFMKTAKAKGLSQRAVIIKHAIKNAILPVVTVLGIISANLVVGSFVIENTFGIPGIGDTFVKAITNRDYPLIMATTVIYGTILVLFTLIVDISYIFIDPRIKIPGAGGRKNAKKEI